MDDARKFSLKDKIKQFFCLACCFPTTRRETLRSESPSSSGDNAAAKPPLYLIGASSQWIKSRTTVDLPEIKYKCGNLFGRIRGSQNHHGNQNHHHYHRRRRSSADFRYDPLSYALNFEEDLCGNVEDDAPLKNFASRLPSSPPTSAAAPADDRTSVL